MGGPGLEPGANRLKAEYSTIELATRVHVARLLFIAWSLGRTQDDFKKWDLWMFDRGDR